MEHQSGKQNSGNSGITENALKYLKTLFRTLYPKNRKEFSGSNFDWIKKDHEKIYEYIKEADLSKSTKKTYLSGMVTALKFMGEKDLFEQYKNIREDMQNDINKNYDKNVKSEKHVGTFEGLIQIRNELKENEFKSLEDNYKYLITCLYTYQYPLRKEWRQVILTIKKIENFVRDSKDYKHYLMIDKHKNMVVSLGEYKSHPPINIVLSNTLKNIILNSYNTFNRAYLFEDLQTHEPIKNTDFVKLLKDIGYGDENNFRSLRYSYEFKNKPLMSNEEKHEIAVLMRTSRHMLDDVYKKKDDTDDDTDNENIIKTFINMFKNKSTNQK